MNKYLPLTLLTFLFFFGCGNNQNDKSQNSQTTQFSIQRGPSNGDIFSIAQKVRLEFSAPLNTSTVNSSTVYLEELIPGEGGAVVGSYTGVTDGTNNIYLTPYSYLKPSSTYQITVTTGVQDVDARSLEHDYVYSFTTGAEPVDNSAFGIRSFKPNDAETGVIVGVDIVVDFNATLSEEPAYTTGNYFTVTYEDNNSIVHNISGKVEVFNSLLRFIPSSPLPYDSNITVELTSDVKNLYSTYSFVSGTKWSFVTKTLQASPKSDGFYGFNPLLTGKQSTSLAKFESKFTVARAGGIDIYEIEYINSIPQAKKLSSFVITSPISSMLMTSEYIVLSTLGNGIYILKYQADGSVSLLNNSLNGESIFSVRFGEFDISRIYAAGPDCGVSIFDFNVTTDVLSPLYDINTSVVGTALDVVEVEAFDEIAGTQIQKIYVADYSGGMVILDINGTLLSKINLNTAIKRFTFNEDYNGKSSIFVIAASGKVQALGFDGSIFSNVKTNLPGTISSVQSHVESQGPSNLYYSNFEQGIVKTSGDYIDKIIYTGGSVVSSAYVDAEGVSVGQYAPGYLVSLNSDGKIAFYNAVSDLDGPTVSIAVGSIVSDSNISLSIGDSYLDASQITADKFTLYNLDAVTPTSPIPISVSMEYGVSALGITLDPNAGLVSGDEYKIVVSSTFSDKFGNRFNGGADFNSSFIVQK